MKELRAQHIKEHKGKFCNLLGKVCETGDCVICDLWMEACYEDCPA